LLGWGPPTFNADIYAGDAVVNWANFVSQFFNGLVLGALLALISSGLTIIYGTLGVLPRPWRDVHARRLRRLARL